MNQEGFPSKLNELPSETQTGPQFHSMDLTAHSDLPYWPHAVAMNTADDPEDALLVNFYYTLISVQHTLQFALDNPDQYVGEDEAQPKTLQDVGDSIPSGHFYHPARYSAPGGHTNQSACILRAALQNRP